jgi:hypothetical protein
MRILWYAVVYMGIHWHMVVYNGVLEHFLQGRHPDRELEHTIEFGLPRIGEGMGELHRVVYPSMIDLHLGYHQMRDREKDTHRSSSLLHYEFLVMPLGLTNALVTFQY